MNEIVEVSAVLFALTVAMVIAMVALIATGKLQEHRIAYWAGTLTALGLAVQQVIVTIEHAPAATPIHALLLIGTTANLWAVFVATLGLGIANERRLRSSQESERAPIESRA
jgi:hypothetical protein